MIKVKGHLTKDILKNYEPGETITPVSTICHCCGNKISALDLSLERQPDYEICSCSVMEHCFRCKCCEEHCECKEGLKEQVWWKQK
jgi:hypothetical protein